ESGPSNNPLQLTRLACGELGHALPAELRENGSTEAYRPLPSAARVDFRSSIIRQADLHPRRAQRPDP
ncbi:MAG: hypothetical protein MUO38_03015, partial [Anaerolineales bacterium]|nr:hypothetical protein [Anaerolineales bacterium]